MSFKNLLHHQHKHSVHFLTFFSMALLAIPIMALPRPQSQGQIDISQVTCTNPRLVRNTEWLEMVRASPFTKPVYIINSNLDQGI